MDKSIFLDLMEYFSRHLLSDPSRLPKISTSDAPPRIWAYGAGSAYIGFLNKKSINPFKIDAL